MSPAISRRTAAWWMIVPALALVAPVAAIGSYLQALTVVQAADGQHLVSYFVAGLADPQIFAASANIYDGYRRSTRPPVWSWVSLGVGLLVTIGMNVAASDPHLVPPWLVRVWPPVALALSLESLLSYMRRGQPVRRDNADGRAGGCPHDVAMSADDAIRIAYEHGRDCLGKASYREIGRQFGVHHSRVAQLVAPASALNGDSPDE